MSLEQLRKVRRAGRRPQSVTVFVGQPSAFEDGPAYVVVDRDGMDLRPLLGLPLTLIDVQDDRDFTWRVIEDLQALETTLVGGCLVNGAVGVSHEHERSLIKYRRLMCPTTE